MRVLLKPRSSLPRTEAEKTEVCGRGKTTQHNTTTMKKVLIALTFAFIAGPALQAMVVSESQIQEQEMKRIFSLDVLPRKRRRRNFLDVRYAGLALLVDPIA